MHNDKRVNREYHILLLKPCQRGHFYPNIVSTFHLAAAKRKKDDLWVEKYQFLLIFLGINVLSGYKKSKKADKFEVPGSQLHRNVKKKFLFSLAFLGVQLIKRADYCSNTINYS